MKVINVMLFCLLTINIMAQKNVKIFHESQVDSFIVYCTNAEVCPVSIELNFDLVNMISSNGNNKIFVIPANAQKFKVTALYKDNLKGRYNFSYKYNSCFGNATITNYDNAFKYHLPFSSNTTFLVVQGYNGKASHKNEYALDFNMPEGTTVVAARAGIVFEIIQNNNTGCEDKECMQYNNLISILHSDGTIAKYLHLKYNSSLVKLGDSVLASQPIALSGNTGWSRGPHLHFVCSLPTINKWQTIPTIFKVDDGIRAISLEEKQSYTKKY